jgi:hypothetical protein
MKGETIGPYGSFDDIKHTLSRQGLSFDSDYWIAYFSPGWSLGKEKEQRICEIQAGQVQALHCLDIKIEFAGPLGDLYSKEIFCVPRPK